jgi:hypothetical protein
MKLFSTPNSPSRSRLSAAVRGRLWLPLSFAAVVAACSGDDSAAMAAVATAAAAASAAASGASAIAAASAPAGKVAVAPVTTASMGAPVTLSAQVFDAAGKPVAAPALTYAVADPTLASVAPTGVVTPLRAGFSTVTLTAGELSASTTLSVRGPVAIPKRSNYVGVNLDGIAYWTSEFPFSDLMKNSGDWTAHGGAGGDNGKFPSMRDGYPTALDPGQRAMAAVAWGNVHYAPGRYVILWNGDGTVSFPLTNGVVTMGDHRATLDVTDTTGPMWVSIDKTSASNPIHNVRFLWPGTESTYATQPFNPEFLARIAPFSLLRFMDWGATNGSPVVEWADRAHVAQVTYAKPNGVPIEVMIDLANTLHVDPWFCIPHQASDDYVVQFAALLHRRLDPTLKPRIEYSNEVWNAGFAQNTWAKARSTALGLPTPSGMPSVFYAQRAVQVFKLVQSVYGADRARLVRVIAGQAAWTQFLDSALGWKDTAANADVMAIAPYFSAEAADDRAQVNTTLGLSSDAIVDQMLVSIRGNVKTWIAANAALARKYKLKMEGYESGVGNTTGTFPADKQDAMTALMQTANRNPRMHDVYTEYFGLWVANGGGTMNQFNDIGAWGKWGNWGMLEYLTQDPATAPKYQGLLDFIAQHPAPP